MVLRPLWSLTHNALIRGLAYLDESNWLLIWDDHHWVHLWNRDGVRQSTYASPSRLAGVAASVNGSVIVAATTDGMVSLLSSELRPRWQLPVARRIGAVAVDPAGLLIAVADAKNQVVLLDTSGQQLRKVETPRPIQSLSFVPLQPILLVAADLGFVGAIDLTTGAWLWRDTPVTHLGNLAVAGTGEPILLASFSEGVRSYQPTGKILPPPHPWPASRWVACSYDASVLVTGGVEPVVTGFRGQQSPAFQHRLPQPITAIALNGLGEYLWVALQDQTLVALDLRPMV